jgi:hypothetical protein
VTHDLLHGTSVAWRKVRKTASLLETGKTRASAARFDARRLARLLLLVVLGGCEAWETDNSPARPSLGREEAEELVLEEGDSALVVTPLLSPSNPTDRLIVADTRERQVRVYGREGNLLQVVGRAGQGPGEFRAPTAVTSLADGRIVVADLGGGLSIFDPDGRFLGATAPTGIPVFELHELVDSALLLVGRRPGFSREELLHIVDPASFEVRASFFPTPGSDQSLVVATMAGWASASLRQDSIAAVFSLSDTVFVFDSAGHLMETIPVPSRLLRRYSDAAVGAPQREERRAWLESFDAIHQLHWLEDGSFLLHVSRRVNREDTWGWILMTRAGRLAGERMDQPRIIGLHQGDALVQDPRFLEPNRWLRLPLESMVHAEVWPTNAVIPAGSLQDLSVDEEMRVHCALADLLAARGSSGEIRPLVVLDGRPLGRFTRDELKPCSQADTSARAGALRVRYHHPPEAIARFGPQGEQGVWEFTG